ncbi:alpha-galactosidase [Kushneria indalinina]|uniref:Alpha-galactosidase n=1 Tax=Kushneria indalinina DSM 14324 TaxID=1122140 RepID=A0A3D9DSZ8_9GAMM|nr:alpha-galactosidase [Kushneria indalinina]REC93862.1 alpha-galactosidase [Kushneria indalinina DSM 14324]
MTHREQPSLPTDDTLPHCWRLDTVRQTLVLAAFFNNALPCVVYWGARLDADEDLDALAAALTAPIGNNALDEPIDLSICPEIGRGMYGQPGLVVHDAEQRPVLTQFTLGSVGLHGGALVIEAVDRPTGLGYRAVFQTRAHSDIIESHAELSAGETPVTVAWLSAPVMPVSSTASHMLEFAGRWTREFGLREVAFARGVHLRESRRGRTGHDHFPAILFPEPGCTDNAGEVRALHFGFSGAHRLLVECLADGRRQLQAGVPEPAHLASGDVLTSQTTYLGWADAGLSAIGQRYQQHLRHHVVTHTATGWPRPVHYNCWEAVYFDHDIDTLTDLAGRAAALGAERFVLDDGWFGRRDDDTTSLGDWQVDTRKYPHGLAPLIEHVRGLGMRFGLWVEPEMISPDSDLARAHSEWMIAPNGRHQPTARHQQVLDLTAPGAAEYLFTCLDALLTEHEIDYLKWDMNRDLTLAVDGDGRPLLRRQTLAVYALLDRLRARHPRVEIESCASGGGRIDYAILARTQRVWLSDSNDAHERWRMQHDARLFLPSEIMGSHVGPRLCHTSGRRLSMAFRAGTALTGHMGFEMDVRELTEAEQQTLMRYTAFYKRNRQWLHTALDYRLCPGDEGETRAHMSVAADGQRFLLFSATLETPRSESTTPLCLAGLADHARYRVTLWNREDMTAPPTRFHASPLVTPEGLVLSGRALMHSGLRLPIGFPDSLWVVIGERIDLPPFSATA